MSEKDLHDLDGFELPPEDTSTRALACMAFCQGVHTSLLKGSLLDLLKAPAPASDTEAIAVLKRIRSDLMEHWRPGGWSKADCINGITARLNKPEFAALLGGKVK